MKFYDNTKYTFVVALIRALESRMLTSGNLERMIDAKDGQEAYRVLNDFDYAEFLGESEKPENFQTVINAGLIETKETIMRYTPYPEIMDIMWLHFDFHNLKVLTKAYLQGKELNNPAIESILMPLGKYTFSELIEFFNKLNSPNIKTGFNEKNQILEAIREAIAIYTTENDPSLVDAILDKAFYALIQTKIQAVKIAFLNEYFVLAADLANIRMFTRSLVIKKEELFKKLLFIKGGTLGENIYTGNLEEFKNNLSKTVYANLAETGIKGYHEHHSFLQLEKEADGMLLDHMIKARYVTFGPEPVFAFFWVKENNAQIIRTIMVNKLNNVDPMEIRKKIRKLYQ